MAAKYGIPYFSNYINSDMEPSDVRSMCPLTGDTIVTVRNKKDKEVLNVTIEDILYDYHNGIEYDVWTKDGWRNGKPVKMPMTEAFRIVFENGCSVTMGENHLQPIVTNIKEDGTFDLSYTSIPAKRLSIGDLVPFYTSNISDTHEVDKDAFKAVRITSIEELDLYERDNLYCFEVDNEDHIFMLANGLMTHNCRLRLDLRELRKKSGGFFGSGENTGSIGVVTINMPRIAYLSENEEEFFERLDHLMDISAKSLRIKRETVTNFLEAGLYPYTKKYLGTFNSHFSTLGLTGMNEACLNAKWLGVNLIDEKAQDFTEKVLNHMRKKLADYQEEFGDLYNLEATPAESTAYRFAKHDKEAFPNIITANEGGDPYYTNSSHLPVGFTDDIFKALDIQDRFQTKYTSGTVFHTFLGERLTDWVSTAKLVKTIAENYSLPYYTLSPTYSVCCDHGYIAGEEETCPTCGKKTEIYSRITGYYRAVQNWNTGKTQEFHDRKEYTEPFKGTDKLEDAPHHVEINEAPESNEYKVESLLLFTTPTCGNCKTVKKVLKESNIEFTEVNATAEECTKYNITMAPTLIVEKGNGEFEAYRNASQILGYIKIQNLYAFHAVQDQ